MNKIEELENKIEDLKKELEELKKSKKVNKRWRAEEDYYYYYIDSLLTVYKTKDAYYGCDDYRYKIYNYFKTQEEAEKVAEKIKIYVELKDLAEELNEGVELDWENEYQPKYYIYKDFKNKKLDGNCVYELKDLGQIYCLNSNFLKIAIERIGEERLMKLFE